MSGSQPLSQSLEAHCMLGMSSVSEDSPDQQWLIRLMQKSGATVLGMLWRMLGNEADVLDAYQSAVCKVAAVGRDAVGRNPAGYFYRTASHVGIEMLRSRRTQKRHWPKLCDTYREQCTPQADEAEIDRPGEIDQLRSAICALPPQLRNVIVLRDLAGLPYRTVAATLGIRVGTARLYRRQAVVRLADMIGEQDDEERLLGS